MTVADAARLLEVSPSTVYELCRRGDIPHYRIGLGRGRIRIDPAQLREFLDRCRREGRGPGPEAERPAPAPETRDYTAEFTRRRAARGRPV